MVQTSRHDESAPDSKAHRRKREILQAASRAFRRQGLHATGMRDIANESKMHVGNLYYYFRNKEEILAFCQEQTLTGLIDLAEQIQHQPWLADEKLHRLITGHVVRLNDEMPGSLAHLEVEALEGPWKKDILKQRNRYELILCQIIEEGIETGLFRNTEPGVAAKAILGAANWTVKWYQPRGSHTSREIGEEFAILLVRGLLAPGRRPSIPELQADPQTHQNDAAGRT